MVRRAPYGAEDWLLYLFHLQEPIEIDESLAKQIIAACQARQVAPLMRTAFNPDWAKIACVCPEERAAHSVAEHGEPTNA